MEKRRNRLASSQPPCTHTGSWKRTSQLRASGSTVDIKSLSLSRSFFYSPLLRSTVRRTSAVCLVFSFSLKGGGFEIFVLEDTKNLKLVLCHRWLCFFVQFFFGHNEKKFGIKRESVPDWNLKKCARPIVNRRRKFSFFSSVGFSLNFYFVWVWQLFVRLGFSHRGPRRQIIRR